MRQSASMVFDTILGRRKDDYHGDIYHGTESTRTHALPPRSDVRHVDPPSPMAPIPSLPPRNEGFWRQPERRRARFLQILNGPTWKTGMILFAFVLLFGEQVRVIFLPPAADNAVDTVFCLVIAFFLTDIGMRCDAEDGYFTFSCRDGYATPERTQDCCPCACGSFLFWCDLTSTLALFYDISWIRTVFWAEETIDIVVDSYGVPVRYSRFSMVHVF